MNFWTAVHILGLILVVSSLPAQQDVFRAGPGVTAPVILYKVDPEYSPEALSARVQGTVVFELVVDQRGNPGDIAILSPRAGQKYPPAMYLLGTWLRVGKFVDQDQVQAGELINKAADKKYGPAVFERGRACIQGMQGPGDVEKGMKLVRDAAVLGSVAAQLYVGLQFESSEPDRARRYFLMCAAKGQAQCQARLAQLLLDRPKREERDYLQAVAWFELAAEGGLATARKTADAEGAKLTAEQAARVKTLKRQLAPKGGNNS